MTKHLFLYDRHKFLRQPTFLWYLLELVQLLVGQINIDFLVVPDIEKRIQSVNTKSINIKQKPVYSKNRKKVLSCIYEAPEKMGCGHNGMGRKNANLSRNLF